MSAASEHFAATRWTLVLRAKEDSEEGRAALSDLCAAYYQPVFKFLAYEGRTDDAARELTHEFFARVLAGSSLGGADRSRGKFRGYLLGALKHFLADSRDREHALKRGGGIAAEAISDGMAFAPDDERQFDRAWALTVMARALDVTGGELRDAGKGEQFEVLKTWITGAGGPQAEAAAKLGMSEGAVKVAIHRLRQRFREAVKAEVAQTVRSSDEVDEELRHLVAVLVSPLS